MCESLQLVEDEDGDQALARCELSHERIVHRFEGLWWEDWDSDDIPIAWPGRVQTYLEAGFMLKVEEQ